MSIFKKKTTLVHHITYMGIMACINFLFIILDTYVPFLMFLLIFLLPLASTVVSYYCLKRYYIIYAVASIGLCLISGNIIDTIFYIVPALISGFLIGLLLDKKVNPFWIILVSTVVEASLSFAFIPLINLISNEDFVVSLLSILHLETFKYQEDVIYLIIYFLALLQVSLTHFVLFTEIRKIGVEINTGVSSFAPYIIGLLSSLIIALIFGLTYTPLALTFIAISIYFAMFLAIDIFVSTKKICYVLLTVLFVASFFGFALLYTKIEAPLGLILVGFFPLSVAITSFVNNYLIKR